MAVTEAKAEVRRTAVALDSATLAGAAAAMADAVATRQRSAAAVAKVAADAELRHRQRWLRQGEAPCPAMSAVVRRPRSAGAVAGLRVGGPSGGLVTTGHGMAAVMCVCVCVLQLVDCGEFWRCQEKSGEKDHKSQQNQ